jgi:hypothetical protein
VTYSCRGYQDARGRWKACHNAVGGDGWQCETCRVKREHAMRIAAWERDQAARREREQGKTYGPAPEGEDPFKLI